MNMDEDKINLIQKDADSMKEELSEIKYLIKRLMNQNRILLKRKSTNLQEALFDALIKQPNRSLKSSQVQELLGVARNWAIEQMKKLSNSNPCVLYLAPRSRCAPVRILYSTTRELETMNRILKELEEKKALPLYKLKNMFKIDNVAAVNLADLFCDVHKEYRIFHLNEYETSLIFLQGGVGYISKTPIDEETIKEVFMS